VNDLPLVLTTLFGELIDGPSPAAAYMLNGGDRGLLRALESLSVAAASAPSPSGGASIAAHVDHLRFGLELMNRWSEGDADPWTGADWAASWRRTTVDDEEWASLRERFGGEARRWQVALGTPRAVSATELTAVIASVAHLAYHLGAIRQIEPAIKGPRA